MSVRKPVYLNGKHFVTKSEAENYFTQIRSEAKDQGQIPKIITNEEQNRMLEALLDTHKDLAEKIGPGLDYFFVDYMDNHPDSNANHRIHKGTVAFYIQRIDGTVMDFSIPKLINDYGKDPCLIQKEEVKSAFREAIEPNRQELRERKFENNDVVVCPRTGKKMTSIDQARIIYESPSWEELTSGFVSTIGGWDAVELCIDPSKIQHGKRLSDTRVELNWIEYWKKNSNPVICARIERPNCSHKIRE